MTFRSFNSLNLAIEFLILTLLSSLSFLLFVDWKVENIEVTIIPLIGIICRILPQQLILNEQFPYELSRGGWRSVLVQIDLP